MNEPILNAIYRIELCGSEVSWWQYLGQDVHGEPWWRDVETGREFSESSVMYAWQIAAKDDAASGTAHGRSNDRPV